MRAKDADGHGVASRIVPRPGTVTLSDTRFEYRLRKRPAGVTALEGVSLHVEPGEFVAIVGPSGCGKSTLLRMVAGLLEPCGGTVTVDVGDRPKGPSAIGLMSQKPLLLPWRTVLANALLPLELIDGRSSAEDRLTSKRRARRLLETVGLSRFVDAYPGELSAGMQQRVALVRTLLPNPSVLLMDEPFSALDELTRDALNVELLDIWEQLRQTVLFVTHSIGEAVFLSDRVIVMGDGGRFEATIDVELPRPRDPRVADSDVYLQHTRRVRTALAMRR